MRTHLFVPFVAVVLAALAGCTAEAADPSESATESTDEALKLAPARDIAEAADPNVIGRLQANRNKLAVSDPDMKAIGEVNGLPAVGRLVKDPVVVKHGDKGTGYADELGEASLDRR